MHGITTHDKHSTDLRNLRSVRAVPQTARTIGDCCSPDGPTRRPLIDAPPADLTNAVGLRRKPLRRRSAARRRTFAIGTLWALAVVGMGWLLLAGIAGFAHA